MTKQKKQIKKKTTNTAVKKLKKSSNIEKIKNIQSSNKKHYTNFIPWGRTFSTYDNFLGKQKTKSKKERSIVAIDSNKFGEIIVVPLSGSAGKNKTHLRGSTFYKHFVEIEDNEGNPIITNEKFRANHKNMDVPIHKVKEIRTKVFTNCKQKQRNEKLNIKFQNRHK